MFRDGVETRRTAEPGNGMTTCDASRREQNPARRTVGPDRFQCVGRAAGLEPAGGRAQRGNEAAIEMDRRAQGESDKARHTYPQTHSILRGLGIELAVRRPRRFGDVILQSGEIADQDARTGDQNIVMAGAA
jgi:hypothetical protein